MTRSKIDALVAELGAVLLQREETLAVAESCTGGWAGMAITGLPGSSGWFSAGFVTYSNEAKQRLLGVRAETLRAHGAVSIETAIEMAKGAIRHARTDWSLSVTGIAGPAGGTLTRPVGTVAFAWAARNGWCDADSTRFDGDRQAVRAQSVERALNGLLERLREAPQG
ncbi:CinA family protein [Candidatus Foliamicus sp.]